jgi:hypothetical protein
MSKLLAQRLLLGTNGHGMLQQNAVVAVERHLRIAARPLHLHDVDRHDSRDGSSSLLSAAFAMVHDMLQEAQTYVVINDTIQVTCETAFLNLVSGASFSRLLLHSPLLPIPLLLTILLLLMTLSDIAIVTCRFHPIVRLA